MNKYESTLVSSIVDEMTEETSTFDIEVDIDGILCSISGEYHCSWEQEDDYYNGTGAWICRDAQIDITDAHASKGEEEIEIPFSIFTIEDEVINSITYGL